MLAWAVIVGLAFGVGPLVLWLGYLFLRPFLPMSDWSWLWEAALFSIAFSSWKAAAAPSEIQRLLGRLIEIFADGQPGTRRLTRKTAGGRGTKQLVRDNTVECAFKRDG